MGPQSEGLIYSMVELRRAAGDELTVGTHFLSVFASRR